MDIDTGRSGADAPSGLRPDGLSQSSLSQAEPLVPNAHERELLIQRVIMAISTASVPHEDWLPGRLSSRSLGYYLGVGIDHFGHDYNRHETLLRKAAEQAIAAIEQSERTGA